MTEMLLLGAGASAEAGIPTSYSMAPTMYSMLDRDSYEARALAFVVGGLLFQKGVHCENPFEGVDVEEVYDAVRLLADRNSAVPAPFIAAWHPFIEQLEKANAREKFSSRIYAPKFSQPMPPRMPQFHRAFNETDRSRRTFSESEEAESVKGVYTSLAGTLLQLVSRLVWIYEAQKVKYLAPILKLYAKQPRLIITTLNYDNTVELMTAANGVRCETGIAEWIKAGQFSLQKEGLYLLKLHGSANWKIHPIFQWMDQNSKVPIIRVVGDSDMKDATVSQSSMIFGGHNKLTADGPFLDMLQAFKTEKLAKCNTLTIVGYSFRDDHINACIKQWARGRADISLRIVKRSGMAFPTSHALHGFDNRRIEVIPKRASEGLVELFGAD